MGSEHHATVGAYCFVDSRTFILLYFPLISRNNILLFFIIDLFSLLSITVISGSHHYQIYIVQFLKQSLNINFQDTNYILI